MANIKLFTSRCSASNWRGWLECLGTCTRWQPCIAQFHNCQCYYIRKLGSSLCEPRWLCIPRKLPSLSYHWKPKPEVSIFGYSWRSLIQSEPQDSCENRPRLESDEWHQPWNRPEMVPSLNLLGLPACVRRCKILCAENRPPEVYPSCLQVTGAKWLQKPRLSVVHRAQRLLSPFNCQEDQSNYLLEQANHGKWKVTKDILELN